MTAFQRPPQVFRLAYRGDAGSRRAWPRFRCGGPSGTNHLFANSARSPTRGPHYESRKLDNLGGFAGDAFGHHLDWLRYVDYDLRHSGFRERLYFDGYWCGAITIDELRADRATILQ